MKVLVVHCKRTGYGVLRSLRDTDYKVYGADTSDTVITRSKFLESFFHIPEMTEVSNETLVKAFIKIAQKLDYQDSKPVVFTGSDNYLLFFSKNFDVLGKYFQYSFEDNFEILEKSLNKNKVNKLATRVGVKAPKSYDIQEVENIPEDDFPIIIKPALKSTPEINVVEKAFRVKICQNSEDLIFAANQLRDINQDGIIQQYIPGSDNKLFTIGTYSYNGNLIAWSTCAKVRQFPPHTGECSLGKTVYIPELVNFAKKLLNGLQLTGISQIEFKEFEGEYYLIEINPRIWSWHQIHTEVGVNFSKICLDFLSGRHSKDVLVEPQKREIKWQFFWIDMLHNNILNNNLNKIQIIKDFFISEQEAFFCKEDLGVFWRHTKMTLPYMRKMYLKNSSKS